MKKVLKTISYIFTAVGLCMLIGAYFFYANTNSFMDGAIEAKGRVIELVRVESSDSTTYKPVVVFKDRSGSEISFTSSISSSSPGYAKGDDVQVLYQPSEPHKARINSFLYLWFFAVLFAGLGSVFFLVGFSMLAISKFRQSTIQYLKRNGRPVLTQFERVELVEALEVNDVNPYRILSTWVNPRTSEVHTFSSDNIWFDPTEHIKSDEITVLIEPNNPKKYYVDVSFLPKPDS